MQLFIVVILVCCAICYLILKWLPSNVKQKLNDWLIMKVPKLSKVLNVSKKACSGGCASCGECEEPVAKDTFSNRAKVIRIFVDPSTLN